MNIRDRIKKLKRVQPKDLRPNRKNWRTHPEAQRQAFRGLVNEVGYAGALLCYHSEREGGALTLIDGEMRLTELPQDFQIPCLITDLNDDEADKLLAAFDSLSGAAEGDPVKLQALLAEIDTESDALSKLFEDLVAAGVIVEEISETELRQLDPKAPPKMAWVLIGIPTVRFGEINEMVEAVSGLPETVVETTVNDG